MSYLWMIGAIIFYWKERQAPPYHQPAPLESYPKVAVLFLVLMKGIMQKKPLPCFKIGLSSF
jgi:biofilm PGA synthesis N-glycosyltransferase PgaC